MKKKMKAKDCGTALCRPNSRMSPPESKKGCFECGQRRLEEGATGGAAVQKGFGQVVERSCFNRRKAEKGRAHSEIGEKA